MSFILCSKAVAIVGASLIIASISADNIKALASENIAITDETTQDNQNVTEILDWKPFGKEIPLGKSIDDIKILYQDIKEKEFEYNQMDLYASYTGNRTHTENRLQIYGIGDENSGGCRVFGIKASFNKNKQYKSLDELNLLLGEPLKIVKDTHINYVWEASNYIVLCKTNNLDSITELSILDKSLFVSYYIDIINNNFSSDTAIKPEQVLGLIDEYLKSYKIKIFGDILEWEEPPTINNSEVIDELIPEIYYRVGDKDCHLILEETNEFDLELGNSYYTINESNIKRKEDNNSAIEVEISTEKTGDITVYVDELTNFNANSFDEVSITNEYINSNKIKSIAFEYADEEKGKYELNIIPAGSSLDDIIEKFGEPLVNDDEYIWKASDMIVTVKMDELTGLVEYIKIEK